MSGSSEARRGVGPQLGSTAQPDELRSLWHRAVLHIDMDCFFVAAELIDNPELVGRPVVVGGAGRRGVVASASYEARAYGIRSAMAMATALRQCPHAVVVPGRMDRYVELSAKIMEIFNRFTPLVEPLSLDEAFCDVTGSIRIHGSPREMARRIRTLVAEELGLSCSVGVATNKSVAKLASEAAKPSPSRRGPIPGRGVVVVAPGREAAFLEGIPLRAIYGIGAATEKRLHRIGIDTVAELRGAEPADLARALGPALAQGLQDRSRGIDHRPVVADLPPKSVSNEMTFAHDRFGMEEVRSDLMALVDSVVWRCRSRGLDWRTATVKVRFGDFTSATRSRTARAPLSDREAHELARTLLAGLIADRPIRLIGFGLSGRPNESHTTQGSSDGTGEAQPVAQLSLLDAAATREPGSVPAGSPTVQHPRSSLERGPGLAATQPVRGPEAPDGDASSHGDEDSSGSGELRLEAAVHSVRQRFGRSAVRPARMAGPRNPQTTGSEDGEPAGDQAGDRAGDHAFDESGRSSQPWGPGHG